MNPEDKVEKIKELITKNSFAELKAFFEEYCILSDDFNNFNEILIYCIESNATSKILEYIINARKDKDLNFECEVDGKTKVPLFEAIKNNAFDKADMLIKNNANINYEYKNYGDIYRYLYLYLNKSINTENLKYILNNDFKLNFSHIYPLILTNKSKFIEIIYKHNYIKYYTKLIKKLINLSKNKIATSNKALKEIINDKDKLQIDDVFYEDGYRKGYNDILRILFKYDVSSKKRLYRRIIKYNLLEKSIECNDYNYIKRIIQLKPFNYKCMNYEVILKNTIKDFGNSDTNKKRISKLLIDSFIFSSSDKKMDSNNDTITNNYYKQEYFNLVLNYAIKENSMTTVEYLIENEKYKSNLNINIKDINNEYPLVTALYCQQNKIFQYLIEHGGDCNTKNNNGISLLVLAIQRENYEIFEYIIEKPKLNIDEKCSNGYSAFMTAMNQNSTSFVESILDYCDDNNISIDINEKDDSGNYPITKAINKNNFDLVILLMEYSIEHKIDMNLKDINGYSLLYLSYKQGFIDMFKYLIEYLDINQIDCTGQSILFHAVNNDDIDMVKYLISNGADLNIRDKHNNSVIDYAIFNGKKETLKILSQKDSLSLNNYNSKKETPLISLIKSTSFSEEEKKDIIRNFINKGCDINKSDKKFNLPPLIHAKYLFESELYNIINDKKLFFTEINKDDIKKIKHLLASILNINITEDNGNTLLHEAVLNKKPEIVKLLIEKGINKRIINFNGEDANDLNEKQNKMINEDKNKIYNEIRDLLK
ncbi:hypothetical protein PIROE2DRAFT_10806 [Piromyces sp. E2]|nr:hypothetical protein PIROE2DRAFT_10806 [Piromyces sp. E2]|eukprot:OUM62827.1 hypothetical protein PIROE2DRAFT_10806 [Piromyces sp. E2]